MLTLVCLSVLLSLEADAQSTTDETQSCSSSSLEEVANLVDRVGSNQWEKVVEEITKLASSQEESANEIKRMKELIVGNSFALQEVASLVRTMASKLGENANDIKTIALNQERNTNETRAVKELLVGNSSVISDIITNVVKTIVSNQEENAIPNPSESCESEEAKPSKQSFVSALISE